MRSHGPQIAKVRPALAWMFTNRVSPLGLKDAPANSSPKRGAPVAPLRSRLSAMSCSWPPRVRPRSRLSPLPSSQTTSVPRRLVVMLSGMSMLEESGLVRSPSAWCSSCSFPLLTW